MYEVGQVLYTVIESKQIILPVKVIEQVTVKSLEGETTDYKMMLPNKKLQKVDSKKFSNLFKDISEIEEYLLSKAKEAIDQMLLDSITLEDEFFTQKNNKENKENITEDSLTCNNETNKVKIDLGDGTVANISAENIEQLLDQEKTQKKT